MIARGLTITVVVALGVAAATRPEPPSFATVRQTTRPSDVQLLDRHGAVLHERRVDPYHRRLAWVALADVAPEVITAIVASEDARFHTHDGVDLLAALAALRDRLRLGTRRGASTITMQVAGLLDPTLGRRRGARTLGQKWHQVRLARALERRWSKAEILEAYLNLVPVRGEIEGIGAAARLLFGKPPGGLDGTDACVLAAMIQSPAAPTPSIARRAGLVATRLGRDVPPLVVTDTVRGALVASGTATASIAIAPHVAVRLVTDSHGARRSTLDARIQRLAREALRRQLAPLRDAAVEDGAVLVADNASGDVLAYVGSSGDLSRARFVDGVVARRQAGSALKPFLYALAIEHRQLTAAAMLDDAPFEIPVPGGLYRPRNYDERFRGPISVRGALAGSINVPAVRALELVGPEAFVGFLRALGVATLERAGSYYGPSLALGSADVTLWDLVGAYRTLAQGGAWSPLRLRPEEPPAPDRRVLTAATAFVVGDILADRESRAATFGLENALATPFWSAVKTGTSKDMRDNWCVGWTSRYTVGVWVGNFAGTPMRDVSGVAGAAPIWRDIVEMLHRDVAAEPPVPPAGVTSRVVAFGLGSEAPRREWFVDGTEAAAVIARAAPIPRIVAPRPGTIVAVDPDIPADRQRVAFEAPDDVGATWILDERMLGRAGGLTLWAPVPGRHLLVLRDPTGRDLDRVAFEVRGRIDAATR